MAKKKRGNALAKYQNEPRVVKDKLYDLLGEEELSIKEARALVWDYIKDNNMQDPNDGRVIIPKGHPEFIKIFGSKPFLMFGLTKPILDNLEID